MDRRLTRRERGGVEEKTPTRNGGVEESGNYRKLFKKSERFDNMVGAPDNRISVLKRTSSDAPGLYIRPFPVLELGHNRSPGY
jgi:hypothetical protein